MSVFAFAHDLAASCGSSGGMKYAEALESEREREGNSVGVL